MKKTAVFFILFITLFSAGAENIYFKADSMTGKAGSKTDTTSLTGNAFVKTDTMEISASSITLSGDDFRYITAEGSVSAKNTKTDMNFSCGKLSYDRDTEVAVLDTKVHLEDTKNEVTADAQMVEYNQNAETAILQIDIKLTQKDNVCTGAYAIYHKNEQMLEISGSPKITQGDDIFRAQEITLDLNSQEITLNGRVQGTVTSSKKSENKSSSDTAEESAPGEEKNGEAANSQSGTADSKPQGNGQDGNEPDKEPAAGGGADAGQ